jgi:tryptophan halogenase
MGRREQPWTANCIAIGLSGGFIEPLESTGLYLAQVASALLVEHFPYTDDMAPLAFRYNRIMQDRFYEILDFINMHYCLTRRTDTEFWREVGRPEMINDRLRTKLDYWRIKPPSAGNASADNRQPIDTGGLWNHHSYEAILYGMDFLRDECNDWYGKNRPRPAVHKKVLDAVDSAQGKLPPHDVWLKRMVGMADYSQK